MGQYNSSNPLKILLISIVIFVQFFANIALLSIGMVPVAMALFGVSIVLMIIIMRHKADTK